MVDGSFGIPSKFSIAPDAKAFATQDIDQDGDFDIVYSISGKIDRKTSR